MILKSFCSIGNLNKSNHFINPIVLPSTISEFNLVLEEPMPIRQNEYCMFYDGKQKKIYLRFLTHNIPYNFDYWEKVKIGELIHHNHRDFKSKLAKAKANKRLYFYVATPQDRYTFYYLLKPTDDNEKTIGELVKMIFIPSTAFVKSCADSEDVCQKLKKYFNEYADCSNGETHIIRTDTYNLASDKDLFYVEDSNWTNVICGYQNAIDELKRFETPQ